MTDRGRACNGSVRAWALVALAAGCGAARAQEPFRPSPPAPLVVPVPRPVPIPVPLPSFPLLRPALPIVPGTLVPSTPPALVLPDWCRQALARIEAAAEELEADRVVMTAAASALPGSRGGGRGYWSSHVLDFELPQRLADAAGTLRNAAREIGSQVDGFGRDPRQGDGAEEWVQGALEGLGRDLASWRSQRDRVKELAAGAASALAAAAESELREQEAREAEDRQAGVNMSEDAYPLLEAAHAAASLAERGAGVAAGLAEARLARLEAWVDPREFRFYHWHPAPLVARLEAGRIPWAEGMNRVEAALDRLRAKAAEQVGRIRDPDSEAFAVLAEALGAAAKAADEWRRAWAHALDLPVADVEDLETGVEEALRAVAGAMPQAEVLARASARVRALKTRARALGKASAAQAEQAYAMGVADDEAGQAKAYAARAALDAEQAEAWSEAQSLESTVPAGVDGLEALGTRTWFPAPGPDRIVALVAEPDREWVLVDRKESGSGPFKGLVPGDPSPRRLALGLPFRIQPITVGEVTQGARVTGTAAAGGGPRPVVLADGGGSGPYASYEEMRRDRLLLVSEEGESRLATAPATGPEPEQPEVRRPPVRPGVESPIAGTWTVAYVDGSLGWVTGEAEVAPDGGSAVVELEHPGSHRKYRVVADSIKEDPPGTWELLLRGQQPHLDARLGQPVRRGGGGTPDTWWTPRRDGGDLGSTPPLEGELTRVPVPAGATRLTIAWAGQATATAVARPRVGGGGSAADGQATATAVARPRVGGGGSAADGQRASFVLPAWSPPAAAPLVLRLRRVAPLGGGWGFDDAFRLFPYGVDGDDSLQGFWEQPVDPSTRQPPGARGRYRMLERDPAGPNVARQVGVEIWWRKPAAKVQLLARTVSGWVRVNRFFLGVPTVIEAVFERPQGGREKEIEVTVQGRVRKLAVRRDPEDMRRFVSGLLLPGSPGGGGPR